MGLTYEFHTVETLTLTDVHRLVARISTAFDGFHGFRQAVTLTAEFHHATVLPVLGALPGVTVGDVTIRGNLGSLADPLHALGAVLQQGDATLGWHGLLGIEVGFREKGQRDDKQDLLGVAVQRGKRYFFYEARGSRASYDIRYRQKFLTRLIRAADLPLNLSARTGIFNLYHQVYGNEIWVARAEGSNGENPGAFRVEVPWPSADRLVAQLRAALTQVAEPGAHAPAWYVTTQFPGRLITDAPPGKTLYDLVATGEYPAAHFHVTAQLTITDPAGNAALRPLCGPDDRFTTYIGQIRLPEQNTAEVELVTTAAGHGLVITPRWPVEAETLGEKLGMVLR